METTISTITEQISTLTHQLDYVLLRTPESVSKNIDDWIILVEDISGRVQAACTSIVRNHEFTELGAFMVHPDFQGQGLSGELWETFQARLTTPSAFLVTNILNASAVSCFKRKTGIEEPPTAEAFHTEHNLLAGRDLVNRVCFVWQPKSVVNS